MALVIIELHLFGQLYGLDYSWIMTTLPTLPVDGGAAPGAPPAGSSRSLMIPATSPRLELAIGMLGLVAALAVLPLPTVAGTPEAASVLAVGAIALLAGHRWGLALVVLATWAIVPVTLIRTISLKKDF
ncbi:MAG: hypothetical protein KDC19_13910 [Saprospiraceae bacterium]|nr:hypothetical protein [Saprospiraceae bacterium]